METKFDRPALLECLLSLRVALGIKDKASWNMVMDFSNHCVGWTDKSLLEAYEEYTNKLIHWN